MEQYKTCNKCKQTLPASDFYRHNKNSDQLRPQCIPCYNELQKAYVIKNRDKRNAYQRKWHTRNPDKRKTYKQSFDARNPEASKTYYSKYAANNPEIIRNKAARKRSRRRNNGEFAITKKELAALYAQPCFYCGCETKHLDHVIPISRGGRHSIGNLVPACATCNLQKSDRFIMEWQKATRQKQRKRA